MHQSEQKVCQNCGASFVIDAQDFDFYEKIKVPAPMFCWECRMQRRFSWRNERSLYKRECDLCGKHIIAIYQSDSLHKVYCNECWYSDKWDPFVYSRRYDFNQPFFVQFKELLRNVPLFSKLAYSNINSEYVNWAGDNKDCYLSFSVVDCEEVIYSSWITKSKNSLDCFMATDSDLLYECFNCKRCYHSAFLTNSRDCMDSMFLFDCINCQDCFMSSNLRNKRYYFHNAPYTKEGYFAKLKGINFDSYETMGQLRSEFDDLRRTSLHKFAFLDKSVNVTGDNTFGSRDSRYVFFCDNLEEVRYSIRTFNLKQGMDCTGAQGEFIYEVQAPGLLPNYFVKFVSMSSGSGNSFYDYCACCAGSSNLFGCVGLRNKSYCILNKQYSKQEYEKLVPKIIRHMDDMPYVDKKGRVYKYGEFFPPELSPFAYNETIAQEYFPLSAEAAAKAGYKWKEPEKRHYQITKTPDQLPDHIKDVPDSITNEVIQCAHSTSSGQAHAVISDNPRLDQRLSASCNEQCTTAFKIIPQELQFYKRMNLPLPRLCPNCRHYQRLKQRNPLKLWHRQCQCAGERSDNGVYKNTISHFHGKGHCPNEFETTYAPERPEIVYCEKCYQAEVV